MPYRLYLDTSVFGALFDEEDPERVALTRSVLRRIRHSPYQAFIGTPTLEEIHLRLLAFGVPWKAMSPSCRRC